MDLTHRNRFSQFTLCLGEFRSAAVPPPQRGGLFLPPFLMNEQDGCATLALSAGEGGTAALNFEAIKPRIFNAVAVGEIHHTDALSRLHNKIARICSYPNKFILFFR